ncbi:hypothetical protein [Nannocystis sp.]|uniref:hypothetical protein n=1 Tax=Nannocystis sp. TaxID=1962667 RepID=UPI0025D2873B|nr:hypothetical protein [Nannocystis sp.]MBK7827499.1 hypothetical protein [Nannocystis sp.]
MQDQTFSSRAFAGVIVVGLAAGACDSSDACTVDASYKPAIDPANFVAQIDNPLFPLVPGTEYTYQGDGETVKYVVTHETKTILGVTCVVVHDSAYVDGVLIEDTLDWFAQDKDGNVWYFGEDTKEYEGGKVSSTEGSWQAGVDGAQPGIVMHAEQPAAKQAYRQEYLACEAEDMAEVTRLGAAVSVPFGDFSDCVETREFTPLEADLDEAKFFCKDVGLALVINNNTGARVELIDVIKP